MVRITTFGLLNTMSIIYDFEGDDDDIRGYERSLRRLDPADEYEYFHDFDSYYSFINRLPKLRRLLDKGEWVGDDAFAFVE